MAEDTDTKDTSPTDTPSKVDSKSTQDGPKKDAPDATVKKRGLGLGIWATVMVLVAVGIGYLTWPLWRAPALDAVRTHVPALASLLPAEESPSVATPALEPTSEPAMKATDDPKPAQLPEPAPAPEPIAPKSIAEEAPALDGVSETGPLTLPDPNTMPVPPIDQAARDRIAALETALADMSEQIAQLSARIAEQTAQLKVQGDRLAPVSAARETGVALLLLGQVQTDLMAGAAYGDGLSALERALPGDAGLDAALAVLRAHGGNGIKTPFQLKSEFDAAARAVATAIARDEMTAAGEAVGGETPGWLARIWEKVSSLVVVRRVGAPTDASGPRAALARAEALVEADDLAGAAEALAALDGAPGEAAAGWRADMAQRTDVLGAFAAVKTALLARGTTGQ